MSCWTKCDCLRYGATGTESRKRLDERPEGRAKSVGIDHMTGDAGGQRAPLAAHVASRHSLSLSTTTICCYLHFRYSKVVSCPELKIGAVEVSNVDHLPVVLY